MKIQFYETLLFALSVLSAVSTATAENSRGFAAPSEGPAYSNSESGLKHLIQDALNAARENDQAKLAELTNSMILPSSEDWFLRVFGPLRGKFYARLYAENSGRIAKDLSEIFAELANSMILPSSEDWFLRVFGPLRGKFYARLYAENSGRIAKDLSEIFAELASDKFG